MNESRRELRETLLTAALPHVAFDGWTMSALEAGAADIGLTAADARRAFPEGPVAAVALHSAMADRAMRAAFAALDPPPARTRDKIVKLIRMRLENSTRDREAVRLGLGLLARPQHAARGLKALALTADAIWRAAGDRSADSNWYTKRGIVAAVYMATVAYWLSDRSEGFRDTWSFLERRIDTGMKLPMRVQGLAARLGAAAPRPGRIVEQLKRRRAVRTW